MADSVSNHSSLTAGRASREHYPDIIAAGSLRDALTEALRQAGSPLTVSEPAAEHPFDYARIEHGSRDSQMYIARETRMFLLDFWADRISLASYRSPSLSDAVAVLGSWLIDELTPSQLAARHPAVRLSHRALSYEKGTLIADAWNDLLAGQLEERVYGDLHRFISAASERAELREMLPYLTLWRFSVSPAHYPRPGYPVVQAVGDDRFAVMDYQGITTYGEGDAHHAVELLLAEIHKVREEEAQREGGS